MVATNEMYRTLYGKGEIMNVTANMPYLGFEDVELMTDVTEFELPMGGGLSPDKAVLNGDVIRKLKTTFHQISPDLFAILYGGTKTTGAGEKVSRGSESLLLVDPGTLEMTLANIPTDDGAVFIYRLEESNPVWFSQAVAAAEDVYSIAAAVCTFHADNDDDMVYAFYAYAVAAGDKVVIDTDDLPAEAHLICVLKGNAWGNPDIQLVLDIPSAIPKPPPSLSAPRLSHNGIEVEWGISGQIEAWFEKATA